VLNLALKVKPIKVLLLPGNTLHRLHYHPPQPARFCLPLWHLANWHLLLNHLPPLAKFCPPLKMQVLANRLMALPNHYHPAKALPLLHLTARALLVKFYLPLKALPLPAKSCPPR
jgi:hypothetical protein